LKDSNKKYWQAVYEPFGEVYEDFNSTGIEIGDSTQNGIVWSVPFRFPGQYQDPEDELYNNVYYNRHRWYMPGLGRYNRADPKGIHTYAQAIGDFEYKSSMTNFFLNYYGDKFINPYHYVNNNPVMNSDESGEFFVAAAIVAGGVTVAAAGAAVYGYYVCLDRCTKDVKNECKAECPKDMAQQQRCINIVTSQCNLLCFSISAMLGGEAYSSAVVEAVRSFYE